MPTRITREDLQRRLTRSDGLVLVEALGAAFFGDAHLPGAINIPPGQVEGLARQLIPDLAASVVVYGSGSRSSAEAVAGSLESIGYTNVAVYVEGKEDWVEHGFPIERSDVPAPQDVQAAGDQSIEIEPQ